MADLDRLAKLSPEQRTRLQERLVSRAASKLRAAARTGAAASNAPPPRLTEPGAPVAIVGMACRFGGAPNLDAYWRLIRDGIEGVVEVPADRWRVDDYYNAEGGPGKTITRRGAFVEGIDQFEPTFFGVTPREASRMDPQQRMLLEVAWEAMENAGCPADRLAGTATGVYVGVGGTDYKSVPIHTAEYFQLIDAHVGTGNALSIASNRVSYALDLRGPSMSVDTACSSSSLAIHLAVESLRRGECSSALAGGVNAIITPETTIAFSQAHMLSPEGRCRSYDAGAGGYVRGEGCAMVLLKRLDDAQRDGDQVLGVILGSAVNQDGRTPGISAPSVTQQEACLQSALADAGLQPDDVDYIEGHGTGTPLGDPIELQALAHVFRKKDADQQPLWVTSVKSNIGHTETVSGAAGLIKTVLLMQHEVVPPQLHLERLNPHAHLEGSRVTPLTERQQWPSQQANGGRRRVAGVSSFGFGGTNTHLVIGEAPLPVAIEPRPERTAHVLKLAAKTPDRIPEQAARLAAWLRSDVGGDATVADVAFTHTTGRCDFQHRVAVVADSTQTLLTRLDNIAAGDMADDALVARDKPGVAWLFTGQGAQRVGMGRGLYETEPVFRRIIDRCDAALADVLPAPLVEVLYGGEDDARIHQTLYTQPALFAVECGLAALWKSWGVEPDVLLGHSIGEYAAAVTAGVMRLEDAAKLVGERARLMQSAPGDGGMAVVFADEATVAPVLVSREARLAIAAVNGPQNTVLSGDIVELEAALTDLRGQGVDAKRLVVSHAFHSPLMDSVLDEFERFAAQFEYAPPLVPIASNVTGQLLTDATQPEDWPRYWRDHLRGTVRFADGVAAAAKTRATHWIEIGPAPVLAGMAAKGEASFADRPRWLPSLRPSTDDVRTIAEALAAHWAGGGVVNWRNVWRGREAKRLPLPNYPWKRERFWYDNLHPRGGAIAQAASDASPVLGGRVPVAAGGELFEAPLDAKTPAWLVDHQVRGSIVAPAAMFVEQALAAAAEIAHDKAAPLRIDGLAVWHALVAPSEGRLRLQTSVARAASGRRRVTMHSAPSDEPTPRFVEHAEATILEVIKDSPQAPHERDGFDKRVVESLDRASFYQQIASRGLEYGQAFRVLDDIKRSSYDATATLLPSKAVAAELSRYRLHPAIGDALLQTIAGTLPLETDGSSSPYTYLPVRIESVRLHRPIEKGEPLSSYAIRRQPAPDASEPSPELVEADAFLLDGGGKPIASLLGVRVQRLAGSAGEVAKASEPADWLYQIEWRPAPLDESAESPWPAGPTIVFADADSGGMGVGDKLVDLVEARGGACVVVRPGATFTMRVEDGGPTPRTTVTIDPADASHYERLIGLVAANPSGKPVALVHAWSLDASNWEAAESLGVGGAMRLVQQLARRGLATQRGVLFVTRGAQSVGSEGDAFQAATVGLGRVAMMEHPELGVRLVDLDAAAGGDELLAELTLADKAENQAAWRAGQRHTARLAKAGALADKVREARDEGTPPPDAPSWRLEVKRAGSFDALTYKPTPRIAPDAGQVELEVHATGLNFSDVLKALGLYPGLKPGEVPLGIEASGVVTAVGEGVEHLQVGDEAIGVLPHAFGSHATTRAYAVVRKPAGVTHEEAATIPIVFLTAHHALVRLAQLERGERVLIHAGAGGVGLAAIQIAQHVGAEIFATAGSDEKRELLRSLGVKHVMDSRSLDFVHEVREATGGEGVDVVLNSLPGEAIDASLGLLRAYGRFCEIGKIDIYQDRKLGLLPFQDNLSYFAIDLDRLFRERPKQVERLYAEVMQRFAEGVYHPLPLTRFAASETADAFRYMSLRKNIGKVVVSMREASKGTVSTPESPAVPGRGYLVTGGLGALGRQAAQWLVAQGAAGVALLSRREPDSEAESFLQGLRDAGAQAVCLQGDVADRASLHDALASLPSDFPRVTGVLHAAGVLDDGLLGDLSAERLAKVLRPKAIGAWNLHEATLDVDSPLSGVTQFVLFSSVAATLGSPGQANYAAANAALDALAAQRHSLDLPATSIGWGPWAGGEDGSSGAGMAAGETADAVRAKGMDLLPPRAAFKLMGSLVESAAASVAVFDARWDAMSRLLSGRRTPLLDDLLTAVEGASSSDGALRQRLLSATPDERETLLVEMVRGELARVTSVAAEEIDVAAPLTAIGIDSLMALELKNNLEAKLAIMLPMGKLLAGPSVRSLAQAAAEELVGEAIDKTPHAWQPLVTLREGAASKPALFLMPVLGGDAGAYRHVVEALPAEMPVVAIRPRGLDTDDAPHDDARDTARDYAAAIRERQPTGPYHLAGWSTGGITALAVAEELEAAGQEVARVALFDTPPPAVYHDTDVHDDASFLAAILDFSSRFSGVERPSLSTDQLAGLPEAERFTAALEEAKRAGVIPAEVDESYVRRLVAVAEALVLASRGYAPQPHKFGVLFFKPTVEGGLAELSEQTGTNLAAWRTLLGRELHEVEVPGDHFSMVSGDGAKRIAAVLAEG
ncbi:type I polyketide synthase [Botrimarina mediterranea]|uniref:Phthiocerol synthesis polyketide synthase type I PpsC n=1 Tax=Botrimarina mediterranea TaxID=2528022 RepID=A0A518K355_9BACT|nr:type I polyketide synthase [Botrimarina mediterranea]QDV72209.1 Phthiocerol synthesis polyketide synthase type I PpsC [Botrimarina mediterranea]QDV76753.1 Phthiocerol synthesis polyketide synthase type I PpsC [Planctomycetes bacterium K2D]